MKKIKILLATQNKGKIREIKKILQDLPVKLISLADFKNKKIPKIVENGRNLKENALKKAKILARWSGLPALADDSGLKVEALGGRPGVESARFAGPGATDKKLCLKVLKLLKNFPPSRRKARFVCVAALAPPAGRTFTQTGVCRGVISEKMKGQNGFGYDPIFYYPPLKKNFGQISINLKNQLSHRAQAFKKIGQLIKDLSKKNSFK